MSDRKDTCQTCEYFQVKVKYKVKVGDEEAIEEQIVEGQCRRHAPRPGSLLLWPVVQAFHWCGEQSPLQIKDGLDEQVLSP